MLRETGVRWQQYLIQESEGKKTKHFHQLRESH